MDSRTRNLLVVVVFAAIVAKVTGESQCYVCSSYMEQCKEKVSVNKDYVHKTKCKSSCFVRKGDDDALYRGCFDGFLEVKDLKSLHDFEGCTNQTWNNRQLPWCLCKGNLCNAESMLDIAKAGMKKNVNNGFAKEAPSESYGNPDPYSAPFVPEQQHKELNYVDEPYHEEYPDEESNQVMEEVNHADAYTFNVYDKEFPLDDFVENNKVTDEETDYADDENTEKDGGYLAPDMFQFPPFRNNPPYGDVEKYYRDEAESRKEEIQEDYPPQEQQQQYYEEEQNYVDNEEQADPEPTQMAFPQHLAARIRCAKTGFYQNPDDCRTFVACILDPHYRMPYMHLMRCPDGLVWDNTEKICMEYSTTCNIGGAAPTQAVSDGKQYEGVMERYEDVVEDEEIPSEYDQPNYYENSKEDSYSNNNYYEEDQGYAPRRK